MRKKSLKKLRQVILFSKFIKVKEVVLEQGLELDHVQLLHSVLQRRKLITRVDVHHMQSVAQNMAIVTQR